MKRIRIRSRSKEKNRTYIVIDSEEPPFGKGVVIKERYKYIDEISEGTFGKVVRVWDLNTQSIKALKFIKDQDSNDSIFEYQTIKKLQTHPYYTDHPGRNCIVKVFDHFRYGSNHCLLFECLGPSLYQHIYTQKRQFSMRQLQNILRDCLQALKYMHELNYIHSDIKPENIVLRSEESSNVKLVDFGNAVLAAHPRKGLISTRHYRAPEVILNLDWHTPSDIWSLGCVAYELHYGLLLFDPERDDVTHLALIERACGEFPEHMRRNSQFFTAKGELLFPQDYHSKKLVERVQQTETVCSGHHLFDNFVNRMLTIDPERRPTASEMLAHEYFYI